MYLVNKTNGIYKGIKLINKCILCLILTIAMFQNSVLEINAVNFSDVTSSSWYYKDLELLTSKDIISGYPDGTFKPTDSVTREQYIKMVITTLSILPYEKDDSSWSMPYLKRASEYGLIPYDITDKDLLKLPITREEVAYITYKALDEGFDNYESVKEKISDYNDINDAFSSSVLKIYSKGILAGYNDGTFKPRNFITRAESVAVISRMIDRDKRITNDKNNFTYTLTNDDKNRLRNYSKNQFVTGRKNDIPYDNVEELENFYNVNFTEMARKYVEDFLFEFDYRLINENKKLATKLAEESVFNGYEGRYDGSISAFFTREDYIDKTFENIVKDEAIADALFFPTETYISSDNIVRVRGLVVQRYKQTNDSKYKAEYLYKKDIEIEVLCQENYEPGICRYYNLVSNEKISGREYSEGGDLILTLDEINDKYNCDLISISKDYIENLEFNINYENVEYEELLDKYESYYISNEVLPVNKSIMYIDGKAGYTDTYVKVKVDTAKAYKQILSAKFEALYDNIKNDNNYTITIPGKVTYTYDSYEKDGNDYKGTYTKDITLTYKFTAIKDIFYLYGFDNN